MSNIKLPWEKGYPIAVNYFNDKKNLLPDIDFLTEEGFPLGKWVSYQRRYYKRGKLDKEKVRLLEKIGMVWDVNESEWWTFFNHLKTYYEINGTIYPIGKLPTIEKYNLKNWVSNQVSNHNNPNPAKKKPLSEKQIEALESLEIEWKHFDSVWDNYYLHAEAYYREYNDLLIPFDYICLDGLLLGSWISDQRSRYKSGKIKEERVKKLEKIGMVWNSYDSLWTENYILLKKVFDEQGTIYPISNLPSLGKYNLATWVNTQIYNYSCRRRVLSQRQIKQLEELGIVWDKKSDEWDLMFLEAQKYYKQYCTNGLLIISDAEEHAKLKRWIRKQCADYKNGTNVRFTDERIRRLESIGMVWDEYELAWEEGYSKALAHFEEYGSLDVTLDGVGTELYSWIRSQRRKYSGGILSQTQIGKLDSIGMIWDASSKAVRVSFPEKTLFYYLSTVYEDVLTSDKNVLDGRELDIYIPSIKTAIEYDGVYYHKDRLNEDIEKCKLCCEKNIRLIRIREEGLPSLNESMCIEIKRESQTNEALQKVLIEVSKILNIVLDIDINRDHHEIADLVNNVNSPFDEMYNEALTFFMKYGHLKVPVNYKTSSGQNLNTWIVNQRRAYYGKKGASRISNYNIRRLEKIGMVWDIREEKWNIIYPLLRAFYEENHHLLIPRKYCVSEIKVGEYIHFLRQKYQKGMLEEDKIKVLNELNMVWYAK